MTAPNQFLLYDTAVLVFIKNLLGDILNDPTHILMGTPDRGFAEFLTPTKFEPRDGRPPLPRVAISLGDPVVDASRYNDNTIRLLGYKPGTNRTQIFRGEYPTPVKLPYVLDIWTEKYREMNLFEQPLLHTFKSGHTWTLVDIDSISPTPLYGKKYIELMSHDSIRNTGDLEPSKGERVNRRTFGFDMLAWIWDLSSTTAGVVRQVSLQTYRDENLSLLFDVVSTPHKSHLVVSVDGHTTSFGPVAPTRKPIVAGTLIVDATVGNQLVRALDDGSGNIRDSRTSKVTGTVDYVTSLISLTYLNPPDVGTNIDVSFYTTTK